MACTDQRSCTALATGSPAGATGALKVGVAREAGCVRGRTGALDAGAARYAGGVLGANRAAGAGRAVSSRRNTDLPSSGGAAGRGAVAGGASFSELMAARTVLRERAAPLSPAGGIARGPPRTRTHPSLTPGG